MGVHIADMLSLDKETGLYVTQGLLFFTLAFIVLQILSMASGPSSGVSKAQASTSKKYALSTTGQNAKKNRKQ